jgi:hypothetical protein
MLASMRVRNGRHLLQLLGVLLATAGVLAWIGLAGQAISDPEGVTPQSDEGGSRMAWALAGTVLMIAGLLVLHVAPDGPEEGARDDRTPPR